MSVQDGYVALEEYFYGEEGDGKVPGKRHNITESDWSFVDAEVDDVEVEEDETPDDVESETDEVEDETPDDVESETDEEPEPIE